MEGPNQFDSLFSYMTPVRGEFFARERGASKKAVFTLAVYEGEPFIEIKQPDLRPGSLTTAEQRLYEEIVRIAQGNDIFGLTDKISSLSKVSLWETPYLVNMMKGISTIEDSNGDLLTFCDEPVYTILKLTFNESKDRVASTIVLKTEEGEAENPVFLDDVTVKCGPTLYSVKSVGSNYSRIASLLTEMDREVLESYLSLFLTYVGNVIPELDGVAAKRSKTPEHSVATLFFEKVASDKALYLRVASTIDSLGNSLPPGFEPTFVARLNADGSLSVHPVEGCEIEERADSLENLINASAPDKRARGEIYRDGNFFIIPEATAGPFLLRHLPQVLAEFRLVGSEKLREYKVVATYPKLNLKLSSGIDFLEGEGDITIEGEKFTIGDILNQYARKKYVQLSDGNRGILDETYIQRLQRLFRRKDKEGRIRVTLFDLPEVEELIQSKITGKFANKSRSILEGFNGLKDKAVPKYKVKATLRPYQDEGVKWMKYLYDNKLGGCLADDMGLGKTLQTIAVLSMVYPKSKLPSLIVMPRSLLFNWEKELRRFAPKLKSHTYYGPDRNLEEALKANVILTTYGMVRSDAMQLKDHKFECVVLDESQNIKNTSAQVTLAVQMLDTEHRFGLSGTPIENNLTELYSLFRFLNPAMFGTIDDFNASYTYPIQKYGDKDATESLRRKIFPFILRRLKKDVLDDLPDRIDLVRYVEMSEQQKRLYEERRQSYRQQIGEAIARDGIHKSQFMMLQALGELRRIASVPESISGQKVSSPKIEELVESLTEAVSNGHKSVVFFNFLAGLEIVMERLEKLGIRYETMTGSTPASARKRIVERFQSDPDCVVMLLTLKVGGVGLNLTAADTVYIFEPWWNKAAEEQAINRLHRIGQKATVSSFSLITVGTIEEKILQLQEQKSQLFNDLISADGSTSKQLTEQDIEFILS